MTTYTVEWTTEIAARTPEEAAQTALNNLRLTIDSVSHVHSFDVYCDDADEGDGYHHHQVTIDGRDGAAWREPKAAPLGWQAQLDAVVAEIDAEASL